MEPVQECCYAGERMKWSMRVRNQSFLPLVWLDVIVATGKKPIFKADGSEDFFWFLMKGETEAQTGIRVRFVWLLWQQEIFWEESLQSVRRGVVKLREINLQAGDGFGLSALEARKELSVPQRLVVYPRLVKVTVQPFLKISQEAAAKNRGQTEDVTILKTCRMYQPGDPMKRINWRMLARSGRMEVNVYETIMPGCAAFLLDLISFRRAVEQDNGQGGKSLVLKPCEWELENMISLLASCMRSVSEQGLSTALLIPAYGEQQAILNVPGSGNDVLKLSMEALAMVHYETEDVRFPYEEFWQVSHKLGTVYICTLDEEHSGFHELAHHLGRSRVRYLALKRREAEEGDFDCLYAEDLALEPLYHGGKEADA